MLYKRLYERLYEMLYEIIQRDFYGYYVYEKEVYNVIDILCLNPRSSPD